MYSNISIRLNWEKKVLKKQTAVGDATKSYQGQRNTELQTEEVAHRSIQTEDDTPTANESSDSSSLSQRGKYSTDSPFVFRYKESDFPDLVSTVKPSNRPGKS
jgi:hypothetical protein